MQLQQDFRTIGDEEKCLYDLSVDPYEQQNLADGNTDLEADLARQLANWNANTPWLPAH